MTRKPTIGQIIKRAMAGEDLRLHKDQIERAAAAEELIGDIEDSLKVHGHYTTPDAHAGEVLIDFLRNYVLLTAGGQFAWSEEAKAKAAKDEAEARALWLAEMTRLKVGMPAPEAKERAARELRRRYPQYRNKSTKTIADRMQRKPKTGTN